MGVATLDVDENVSTSELQLALKDYPNYQFVGSNHKPTPVKEITLLVKESKSLIPTFKLDIKLGSGNSPLAGQFD